MCFKLGNVLCKLMHSFYNYASTMLTFEIINQSLCVHYIESWGLNYPFQCRVQAHGQIYPNKHKGCTIFIISPLTIKLMTPITMLPFHRIVYTIECQSFFVWQNGKSMVHNLKSDVFCKRFSVFIYKLQQLQKLQQNWKKVSSTVLKIQSSSSFQFCLLFISNLCLWKVYRQAYQYLSPKSNNKE